MQFLKFYGLRFVLKMPIEPEINGLLTAIVFMEKERKVIDKKSLTTTSLICDFLFFYYLFFVCYYFYPLFQLMRIERRR